MNSVVSVASLASATAVASPAATLHPLQPESHPDAVLIDLVEQYSVALRKWSQLSDIHSDLEYGPSKPMPDILNTRESDKKLLAEYSDLWSLHDNKHIWSVGWVVDALRKEKWPRSKTVSKPGRTVITTKHVAPSAGSRARADEIIAAYDDWQQTGEFPKRGYKKARREAKRAERELWAIEDQIENTRAKTTDGMMAKIRWQMLSQERSSVEEFYDTDCLAKSILKDIQALAATS